MAVALKEVPPLPAGEERTEDASTTSGYIIDRVFTSGFVLAVVAVAVQTVAHLTNALVLDYEVWNFDANQDGNALAWASSVATFAAALGALLLGLGSQKPNWRMIGLAAVLAFLSVDDVAAIHEKLAFAVGDDLGLPRLFSRAFWPLLYVPLFALVVVMMWQLSVQTSRRLGNVIRLGLGLLVFAIAAEAVATLWWSDDGSRFLLDDIEVALEEGAELGGWILIATGMLGLGCARLLGVGAGGETFKVGWPGILR